MGLKVTNNAFGTLNASINSSATTIVLVAGQGARFPTLSAGDYFYATLIDTSNNLEIVKVTARSTDTLTVVRAQDSTTARAYATNDRFELRPTAALFNEKANDADVVATYLPKAGGTMTGQLVLDYNNTAALVAKASSASAQIKLERTSTSTGSGYIGADDVNCLDIRDSSISTRVAVSQSGYLKLPYQPAFITHCQSSDQGGSGNKVSNAPIIFTGIKLNRGTAYSTSTGRYTAPVSGLYEFSFHSNLDMSAASGWVNVTFNVSSGDVTYHYEDDIGLSWQFMSFTNRFYLSAGDYVYLNMSCSGGSVGCDPSAPWSRFEGHLIG
jgi:hypothetical protein